MHVLSVIDHLFARITERSRRRDVVLILSQAKAFSQKRPQLLKLGLPRMLIDEMEILSEDIGSGIVFFHSFSYKLTTASLTFRT